jgi:uncharacterized protein (DUF2345 family)
MATLSPKVPGTNGDAVTKSARHQWGRLAWDSAPALGFGPLSPKVPGTNGDAVTKSARHQWGRLAWDSAPSNGLESIDITPRYQYNGTVLIFFAGRASVVQEVQ